MKVSELIEALNEIDGDLEIVTDEYNSGYGGYFSAGYAGIIECEIQPGRNYGKAVLIHAGY